MESVPGTRAAAQPVPYAHMLDRHSKCHELSL